jgi:hypothetical protein
MLVRAFLTVRDRQAYRLLEEIGMCRDIELTVLKPRSVYGPFMVHELFPTTTKSDSGSHPHRLFSVGYGSLRPFHGDTTRSACGSNQGFITTISAISFSLHLPAKPIPDQIFRSLITRRGRAATSVRKLGSKLSCRGRFGLIRNWITYAPNSAIGWP